MLLFFFFTVISEDPSWILKKEPSFFLFLPHHFSLRALELLTGAERRHGTHTLQMGWPAVGTALQHQPQGSAFWEI